MSTLQTIDVKERLDKLGIVLPEPAKAAGMYKPAQFYNKDTLVVISGHTPDDAGSTIEGSNIVGQVRELHHAGEINPNGGLRWVSITEAKLAARATGIAILSSLNAALKGDWRRFIRLVEATGVVNSAPDFTKHPQVINGFSELMAQVFGEEKGIGARSATGASSLPGGVPVEITRCVFEIWPN